VNEEADRPSAGAADLSRLRIRRDEPARRRWVPWLTLAALVAVAVAVYPTATSYLAARRAPEVDVVHASQVAIEGGRPAAVPVLVASGYVIARRSADVGGKVGGRLGYLGVEEGDRVREGQVIARLEHAELDAQLLAARMAVAEAEAQIKQAVATRDEDRRALDRQRALQKDGITTEAAVTAAEAAAQVSEARVQLAQAALATARARVRVTEEAIENTNVRAPFNGVVIAKRAEVGETVSPFGVAGQATREGGAIATIADLRELEVETEVSESSVAKLRTGMPAEVRIQAYPDVAYRARLRTIFPAADRAKAIVEVRVAIENPDERVKPEMTATVTFPDPPDAKAAETVAGRPATLSPKRAVVKKGDATAVWLVRDSKAVSRPVSLGADRLDMVEVRSGVAPGDSLIVGAPETLTDGATVKVKK
jgi:RND family efflux transporter MFP subunit